MDILENVDIDMVYEHSFVYINVGVNLFTVFKDKGPPESIKGTLVTFDDIYRRDVLEGQYMAILSDTGKLLVTTHPKYAKEQ